MRDLRAIVRLHVALVEAPRAEVESLHALGPIGRVGEVPLEVVVGGRDVEALEPTSSTPRGPERPHLDDRGVQRPPSYP
eukprot:4616726-Lingulodinium_polyedra.AAC.1